MRHYLFYLIIFIALGFSSSCNKTENLPTTPDGIGQQIKEARMNIGVSQEELASAIGLSKENLQTIEKGVAVPTRDIIVEIEETLGIEIILDSATI